MKKLILAVAFAGMLVNTSLFAQRNDPGGNNCLHFDGVNDYVNAGNVTALNGASTVTIEMWVNIQTWQTWKTFFSKFYTPNNFTYDRIEFQEFSSTGDLGLMIGNQGGGNSYGYSNSHPIYTGEWFHLAMVYDGAATGNANRLKLYINGQQVTLQFSGTIPAVTPTTSEPVLLGGESVHAGSGGLNPFIGKMDEVRIWTSARTQLEIQQNMNTSLTGAESGLLMYYNFNQGVAGGSNAGVTTLIDGTSNHFDGTLNNFALTGNTSNWVSRTYTSPVVQANNILSAGTYSTELDVHWANGSGSARAVFMTAATSGTASPSDGVTYAANSVFGSGDQIGSTGWYCVFDGNGNALNVTGLSQAVTYRIMVCEHNGSGATLLYSTVTASNIPTNIATVPPASEPGTQSSQLVLAANEAGINVSWQSGDGTYRAVFLNQTNSGSPVPIDDTPYAANSAFGSGDQISTTGWYCVYSGTQGSVTVTNVSALTTYRAMVCEYNQSGSYINYNGNAALGNPANVTTVANPFTWSAFGNPAEGRAFALAVNGSNVYVSSDWWGEGESGIARWDGNTWSMFAAVTGGPVQSMAVQGAEIYAAGDFASIGGVSASRLAKWDGNTWSEWGGGANGYVFCLAADGNGNIFAGGDFTTIGGVSASRIAKWDGNTWSPLGAGTDNLVYSLATDGNGNVYAGGWFVTMDGVTVNGMAKWNGSTWSALGSGAGGGGGVASLTVNGADVYAGGDFWNMGGTPANGIALWNGSTWSALGSGTDGSGGVTSIVVSGGDVYAGGDFFSMGGVNTNSVAKWNGSSWLPIGTSGVNGVGGGAVRCMTIEPGTNSMVVGGDFFEVEGISDGQYVAKFTDANNTLPIQLASFTGAYVNNAVQLHWTTLSEINNYGFNVQRHSSHDSTFVTIPNSFIPGHGTTNQPQHYGYIDSTATGGTWTYRLKQTDLDGSIHYSDGIHVSMATAVKEQDIPTVFSLSQNYPNPFNPATTIRYGLPKAVAVSLTIYNMLGQEVSRLVNEQQQAGYHEVVFRGDGLASGAYFCRLDAGTFTSVKRLLLLK